MVRAFLAIRCPEELKEDLISAQKKIAALGDMKLVEPENLHMTVKFLGDVDERRLEEVIEALGPISQQKRFCMSLSGIGVFPNPSHARVVWAGASDGKEEAVQLQAAVDNRLHAIGFPREERFHAHFTLARVKSVDKEKMRKLLAEYEKNEFGSFTVDSIDLMESRLSPDGPTYSILKSFKLI
jgi:2'-5' RNA ligase